MPFFPPLLWFKWELIRTVPASIQVEMSDFLTSYWLCKRYTGGDSVFVAPIKGSRPTYSTNLYPPSPTNQWNDTSVTPAEKNSIVETLFNSDLKARSSSLPNRSVYCFIILKIPPPTPHTHTQSYSISCAQIKGILGKNDKSSFCSKSGPTCNDYLPFSCNWELKRLVLYPPGVKELMRSITGKQMSINYWWFQ